MKNGLGLFYSSCNFIITAVSNGANLTDGIDGLRQELRHICTTRDFTFSGNIIFLII
jgi:UDP-N-acetylmuramyl pentapeptide phosphotransferase/UDP-N-acetylglucosamine-1-phosphate transferase